MLRPKDVLENRYVILGPDALGQGGMGKVWKAEDKKTGSIVAVKEFELNPDYKLSLHQKKELQDLFLKEAELLGGLDHNAFPKIRDRCTYEDTPCIVMDFVPGEDFTKLLRQRDGEPFEVFQLFDWLDQLLDALSYLHNLPNLIIHKDIKPGNLKLTQNNQIKILDFGIAKGSIGEMTLSQNSVPLGTLRYAPLEQALKASPDYSNILSKNHKDKVENFLRKPTCPQTDIFSLCATSYRLLAGNLPENFDALSRALYVWDNKADPLPDLHDINPNVPQTLSDLIKQGMSLQVESRIESAAVMKVALQKIREDEQRKEKDIERKNLEDELIKKFELKLTDLNVEIERQNKEIDRYIEEKKQKAEEISRYIEANTRQTIQLKNQTEEFKNQTEEYERQIKRLEESSLESVKPSVDLEELRAAQQLANSSSNKLKEIENNLPEIRKQIIKNSITVFGKGLFENINNRTFLVPSEFSGLDFFKDELDLLANKLKTGFGNNSNIQPEGKLEQKEIGYKEKEIALSTSLFTLTIPIPLVIAAYWAGTANFGIASSLGEKLFLLMIVVPLLTLTIPCCSVLIFFLGEKLFGTIKEIKYKTFLKYIRRLALLVFICGISGAIFGLIANVKFNSSGSSIIKGNILGMVIAYCLFYFLFYLDLVKKGDGKNL